MSILEVKLQKSGQGFDLLGCCLSEDFDVDENFEPDFGVFNNPQPGPKNGPSGPMFKKNLRKLKY